MKNIFKYCVALCAILAVFILAGCLNDLAFEKNSGNQNGGLRITINGDGAGRTLYPSANFTAYRLEFTETSGAVEYNSVDVDAAARTVEITDIPNGTWEITAYGIVTINGNEYDAAEGTTTVIVTEGKFQGVNITLSATQDGDDGFFSWSIGLPSTVNYAYLEIHDFINYNYYDNYDILNNTSNIIQLPPGYYLMNIRIQTPYRNVAWTEVIHIYSNMETKAERVYTEEDLTKFFYLSGEVSVNINGIPYTDNFFLDLYKDANYSQSFTYFNFNGDNYIYCFPFFDGPVTLYARLFAGNFSRNLGPIELNNTDIVFDINADFASIKASGTADIFVNDVRVQYGQVRAERVSGSGNSYQASFYSDGKWEINFEEFASPTQMRFSVDFCVDDTWLYNRDPQIVTLFKNDVTIDFNIDISTINIGGTFDITVNGQVPESMWIEIYRDSNRNEHITYGYYNDEIWQAVIESFNSPTTLYIFLGYELYNGPSGSITLGSITFEAENISNQDRLDINLVKHLTTVEIGGTANIRIDGVHPDNRYIIIFDDANYVNAIGYYYVELDGSNYKWSADIDRVYLDTTLYFGMRYYHQTNVGLMSVMFAELGPKMIHEDTPIILDANITTITLSGPITKNITINGQPYNGDFLVSALIAMGSEWNYISQTIITVNNNTWSLKIPPFSTTRTLYLLPMVQVAGNAKQADSAIQISVGSGNVSNKNLALNFDFEGILLNGTVNIVEEGVSLPYNEVVASLSNTDMWYDSISVSINNDGSWTLLIENFDTPTTIYFWVRASDGNYYEEEENNPVFLDRKYTGVNITLPNQNIPGIIDLGTHKIGTSGFVIP